MKIGLVKACAFVLNTMLSKLMIITYIIKTKWANLSEKEKQGHELTMLFFFVSHGYPL